MRVPLSWMREYVAVSAPTSEIAERLGISSVEVVGLERVGPPDEDGNLDRLRVGRVVAVDSHPERERLRICQVDVGEGEPRLIVCGATNVSAGAHVPVALPGARLSGLDAPIERRKFAGTTSDGMLLSESELGVGEGHAGIALLDAGAEVGAPLADVMPLVDEVLEVEVTGNRPDLLCVQGIAREVATLFLADLEPADEGARSAPPQDRLDVTVEDWDDCPRYIGRRFVDIAIGPSPLWMRTRLHAAGVRSISNVVDVTNYVMVALGSPLHAFDGATLAGGAIVVRRARAGEEIVTLDGSARQLEPENLVIADRERPIAIAGIMGGADTEVTDETSEVVLEAANFDPVVTLRSSSRLHLRTEASRRWEKGVDPYAAEPAANLATRLIAELAGGRWVADADCKDELPVPPRVGMRPQRADAVNGLVVPPERQREILERLRFEVDDWTVQVPTWRARDVTREIDLIEEIARIELDRIPFELPPRTEVKGRLTREQALMRRLQDILVGMGLHEVYTSSLRPDDPDARALRLPNPSTPEQAVLRTTLLTGLVAAAQLNLDARNDDINLFELARVYHPTDEQLPAERYRLAGMVQGDFLDVKGMVEALYDQLHIEPRFERGEDTLLHPGKTARTPAGVLGELHPTLLPGTWGAFELDVDALAAELPDRIQFEDVISYPAVEEDLAFIVPRDLPAGDLVAAIRDAGGAELRSARVFDVYEGPQAGEDRKSVALSVSYQSPERTLTEDDAQRLRSRIVDAVAERFGGVLRSLESP